MAHDIFENIFAEMVSLHLSWKTFRELFGHSAERIHILNSASPIFGPLQDSLIDSVLLAIARLFDPAKVSGKNTVSLDAAINTVAVSDVIKKELTSDLQSLKASCDSIIQLRHRRISHNDLKVQAGHEALQGVSRTELQAAIDQTAAFARKLWLLKPNGGDVGFESPNETDLPFWSNRLFIVLKAGIAHVEANRIIRRDRYRKRYGVDTPDGFDPPDESC